MNHLHRPFRSFVIKKSFRKCWTYRTNLHTTHQRAATERVLLITFPTRYQTVIKKKPKRAKGSNGTENYISKIHSADPSGHSFCITTCLLFADIHHHNVTAVVGRESCDKLKKSVLIETNKKCVASKSVIVISLFFLHFKRHSHIYHLEWDKPSRFVAKTFANKLSHCATVRDRSFAESFVYGVH